LVSRLKVENHRRHGSFRAIDAGQDAPYAL
jgi:hypothetical protein